MQKTDVLGVVLRLSLGVAFIVFGYEKFAGGEWVELFRAIGLGEWFRYFTGGVQMLGAALLFLPRTARIGALLIALTMAGAIAVHLFILPTGVGGAIVPAAFLGFAVAAGWRRPAEPGVPVSLR